VCRLNRARFRTPFPAPVVPPCLEDLPRKPRKLSAYFLPFRPFAFARALRVIGSRVSGIHFRKPRMPPNTSQPPQRSYDSPPCLPPSLVDQQSRPKTHLTLAPSTLQHVRITQPFFSPRLSTKRPESLPHSPEVPHSGLATRSARSLDHTTLGGLSQPPTLLGFPLQSFPPSGWPDSPLEEPSRSCAPYQNPTRPRSGAPAAYAHPKSRIPLAPRMINPGRDPCSLGPLGPLGLSLPA